VAAAKHGQREAVVALVGCGVDVDSREAKVRGDGVALAQGLIVDTWNMPKEHASLWV
jgi:hypothetical protein